MPLHPGTQLVAASSPQAELIAIKTGSQAEELEERMTELEEMLRQKEEENEMYISERNALDQECEASDLLWECQMPDHGLCEWQLPLESSC